MGKSYTYHIIGEGTPDATGSARVYPCMNKREMAQAVYMAGLLGLPILTWEAQTGTGAKWLGVPPYCPAKADAVKLPRLVDCPACGGRSKKYYCPVCKDTGKTTPGYEKGWHQWQIDEIRKDAGLTVTTEA